MPALGVQFSPWADEVAAAATEQILQTAERKVEILVARDEITVTRAEYAAGLHVAEPHLHHDHVDAFYVLEGMLEFQIGYEAVEVAVLHRHTYSSEAVRADIVRHKRRAATRPRQAITVGR
jgi:hypothetical protein